MFLSDGYDTTAIDEEIRKLEDEIQKVRAGSENSA